MRFSPIDPPRAFRVGGASEIELRDCGRVALDADEQVTFTTEAGGEFDICRKPWGFYATPSLNRRLPRFGLRPLLVRSSDGTFYVWLVERGREAECDRYRARERIEIVAALDDPDALARLVASAGAPGRPEGAAPCPCGAGPYVRVFSYDRPPEGEVRFPVEGTYRRSFHRCGTCGHYVAAHADALAGLYSAGYVAATYGGAEGLLRAYERVTALPPDRSDNAGRVRRFVEFARARLGPRPGGRRPTVLDVGSGLCVFLAGMKGEGWDGTALDPDPRAAAHAEKKVGVRAVSAAFEAAEGLGRFDAVALNKVIEHIRDPIPTLARAGAVVEPDGFVYVEVPDGEAAAADGPGREEFFIEHWHAYSPPSLAMTAARAGLSVLRLERLREPSGKYTLAAFLAPERRA